MTFPGIPGADPSGHGGREESSAQGQFHLPAAGSAGPEAGRLENGVRPSTTVNSPGGGGHMRAWKCPCLLVPSSEEGPEWLRERGCSQTFPAAGGGGLLTPSSLFPPPKSQSPAKGQGAGGAGAPAVGPGGSARDGREGGMTHTLEKCPRGPWRACPGRGRRPHPGCRRRHSRSQKLTGPPHPPAPQPLPAAPRAPCPLLCQERTQTVETGFEGWPQQLSPVPGWARSSHGTHRTSPQPLS